jgi:hypothetical protein
MFRMGNVALRQNIFKAMMSVNVFCSVSAKFHSPDLDVAEGHSNVPSTFEHTDLCQIFYCRNAT